MMKIIKINKNVLALVASIALALLCALLLKVIVDKKIASSLTTETVSYVVANSDLPKGTIIDPYDNSKFAIRRDIPAKFAQSTAISPDQANSINGALLLTDIKRGDILNWTSIDTDQSRQLASKLLSGRRALTIPVDDQSSISSMLNPNDHIDLILTYQKSGNIIAAPLMQNIRVLATGDSLSANGYHSADSSYNDSFRTITLDLDVDDVSKITTALELGRLSAVLRNPEDMTYTNNVVSLQTLQRELNLQTFDQSESFIPTSGYDDSYLKTATDEFLDSNLNEEALKVHQTIIPSISVVYGNRHLNK